ncbi:PAS domain S-box-containing protein [Variovorax sp. HW608]|uniref:PAS domain-containing protein n=1 Tax=Variovorax sp. HW608 TaxID=1034889 RepID=UPI00081F8D5E|nr:PAS domain-containing protein [Variovorax sp. HW608]SCK08405.1 PAS domain S-box-containing protein [Variovorax sp. HW608]
MTRTAKEDCGDCDDQSETTGRKVPYLDSPLRVLHLEDDPRDAEMIQSALEAGGLVFDVHRVETQRDFCAALTKGGLDLILADFPLHPFDGMTALEIAREHCPDVPFIFVASVLVEEVAIEAVKNGATDYVLKLCRSRIVNSVRRALREGQQRLERKEADERLRRSEAFLADGQRISHTGSWGWVLASGRALWSDEQYRLLGFEPGSVEPTVERFLNSVHPHDFAQVRRVLDDALRTREPFALEYRIVLPDGSPRHMFSMGRPVVEIGGEAEEYIGTSADITGRVQAEAALRARQELLDLAQQAARAVAFEFHSAGAGEAQARWTPDLASMHGRALDSEYAPFDAWRQSVHPADWPAMEEAIECATRSGELAVEYRVVHPDDSVRWLQAKGRMLFDNDKRPLRIVGFMLDVTEKHDADEELRRTEARLLQAQRLEALGTLAGGIAHYFNNILGGILGYGERMLRDLPREGRLHQDLEYILVAGERGRALVDRILAFSRTRVGERIAVNVESVVREALDLLAAKLPGGISIKTTLRTGSTAMQADPTQIHQVVTNLAVNAIQAMPLGGTLCVSLRLRRMDGERAMTVGAIAAGDYIVLEVRDSGIGIGGETLDFIFDPFFTTKEVGVGTGLGLSLVHGIVTDVGGAIDVASSPGRGSTFTVYLPLTARP